MRLSSPSVRLTRLFIYATRPSTCADLARALKTIELSPLFYTSVILFRRYFEIRYELASLLLVFCGIVIVHVSRWYAAELRDSTTTHFY